ncbi:MAG: surface lipoprotein assembly modifier [Silicimonas sp.]|nr:surface lipoprotein assembly modifier [Silicimonas sp.]
MIRTIFLCLSLLTGAAAPFTANAQTAPNPFLQDFEQARAERARGQFDQAITRLRALLRAFPGDVILREELGLTLLMAKDYGAAQYHFEELDRISTDPKRRALYKSILARIARERPSGINFSFQIAPSTNINSGSSEERFDTSLGTLTIDETSQSQSGTRLHMGLNGFFRKPLESGDQLRLDWALSQTGYSGDLLADKFYSGVTLSYRREREGVAQTYSLGRNFLNSDEDVARTRIGIDSTRRLGKTHFLAFGASVTDRDNLDDPADSGTDADGYLRHIWALDRAQNVFAGLRFERSKPDRAHQSFTGGFLQFGGQKVFEAGTVISGSLSLGARDFDGVFPGQSFARQDQVQEIRFNAHDSRFSWRGFTPQLNCTLRWVQSNLALYQSDAQECGVTLTRRF